MVSQMIYQIGDTIEVLGTGGLYSNYTDMAKKLEIYDIWHHKHNVKGYNLKKGDKGKIINFGYHLNNGKEMIYAILVEPYAYLISWNCVKLVESFCFFTKEEFIL